MKKQSVSNQTDAHGGKPGFRDPRSETERLVWFNSVLIKACRSDAIGTFP